VALELDDPLEEMNPVAEHAKVNDVESSAVYIIVKIIERLTDDPDGSDSANDAFTAKYRIDAGEQGCRVASGLLLYAFPSQVVALVAGSLRKFMQDSVSHTLHAADCYAGVEFDSIVEKLNSVLNSAAQKLDVHEQRKLIKRLYLYWHSKQNTSSSSTLPARVLGALKRLIHTGQLTHSNNFDYAVDALDLTRLELRAAKLWENVLVASEDFVDAGTSSFYPRTKPNPQPREARRWMRQALLDMQAARNDFTSTDCHSPEWACFKCHQAVEKALKAMHYSIDCNRNLTHDLESLSQSLGNNRLHSKVSELSKLLVRSEAMRYPDCHNYPRIPHDVYSGRVETAVRLASEIVDCVERELGR
jgi:HEPN domain-containing protein